MGFGDLFIQIAFVAAVASTIWFYQGAKAAGAGKEESKKTKLPKFSFRLMVAAGSGAAAVLMYDLLTHQFQFSYVYRYSSRELPVLYLISAFWAGQEGTFLLWAVLVGALGLVLGRGIRSDGGFAMSIVSAFAAFLFLLMIVKSPFETLATIPADGAGLNPLLQDPWMAIHPPILFVGYAAVAFPFAIATAALKRRRYDEWLVSGFRWTLFAALMLGSGIIIGGFWAYEVLGWGGYWGWDPVENSSLVPWLTILALVHGLTVQKAKGSLVRTNIFLALVSFVLVLYATFLTRSGVLADFSVHSFVDLGINNYLVGAMALTILLGLGLFALRFKKVKGARIDMSSVNRENALLVSMIVLCAVAVFTFVGMSSPLLTGLVGNPSQVDVSFYDRVNLPVAILMALLLGVTPFLGWVEERKYEFVRRLAFSLVLTFISAGVAYYSGVEHALYLVFVTSAAFALWSNLITGIRVARARWLNTGASVTHIGVALLLIGIVGSGAYDETTHLALKQGEPQNAFGHSFIFQGTSERPDNKTETNVEVSSGGSSFLATPKLYHSEYNRSIMREPDIKIMPLKDLYLSPVELRDATAEHTHPILELTKGETKEIEGYQITFVRFETAPHAEAGAMSVGAVLNVLADGRTRQIVPAISFDERGQRKFTPVDLPELNLPTKGALRPQVLFVGLNVDAKRIALQFNGLGDHAEVSTSAELVLEVSKKPLMLFVWGGVMLIAGGIAISFIRRTATKAG